MRLGITVGDAAGIGPEIIEKALRGRDNRDVSVYASPDVVSGDFEVIDALDGEAVGELVMGGPNPVCARLQLAALERAIADAKVGRIDAIVTAPWTKSLFASVGLPASGHTEVLAARFGVPDDHVMMLAGDVLRVVLVTAHVPLRRVAELVTVERIVRTVEVTARDLAQSFGIASPRIAVCGLNPHASERGHIGREDVEVTAPAIAEARARGIDVHGPFPADTLFPRFRGDVAPFDAVVAMYHDQGLAPLKLRHFGESANITLGLPVVRTSVDHGSAWDIAGKGVADASSMRYAIEVARRMVQHRRSHT